MKVISAAEELMASYAEPAASRRHAMPFNAALSSSSGVHWGKKLITSLRGKASVRLCGAVGLLGD